MTRILIAGAGIGGLTAALCLHEKGFPVRVLEAVEELRPLGVGINLMPHASAVLHGLGLAEALGEIAIRTRCIEYRTRFGHVIQSDPRNVEAGFAAPQYSIHRGELQFLLLETVRERLGKDAVLAGKAVQRFSQSEESVTVYTAEGGRLECDLLIGADGLHSAVRRQIHPDEGPLHYEGTMMWRGAVESDVIADGRTMVIAGDHDMKFVTYPISERARRGGRALTNWVAELRRDRPRDIEDADWTREGTREFIESFREFMMRDMNIVSLMEATGTITEFPMVDRDPVDFWTDGRVTLLGDAAHPMYPIGANGASQAIIDGRVLADTLADMPGPEGLLAYEAARRPATAEIVLANRRSGPERVLDIAAARVKGPGDRIEDLISAEELEEVAAGYRNTAGFRKQGG
ncbi:MAG: flavin-dependent oxidoreductase [Nisaea sp.]|uniref:flavin-dependent oxidoreductase n=1 Tax=Nisaea sp. TaxID=2024842 RepID=UPI001B0540A6|nr:flavin-dependent oxidoreductase [Nisaea sp.]MBO6560794.1 flavin-dependent oxidoreductase [Nisaea sp.]